MVISGYDVTTSKLKNNSWWSRRTRLERNLCASTALLFSTSILTFGILVILEFKYKIIESYIDHEDSIFIKNTLNNSNEWTTYSNEHQSQGLADICLTPACIEAAHIILSNIDETVSPCDDFYKFSCGGWLKSAVIPDNSIAVSSSGHIAEIMDNQLRILVEEPSKPEDPIFFKNIAKMYKSCMNLNEIERLGDRPLINVINLLGRWPVVEGKQWRDNEFDWVNTTLKFRELGLPFNKFFHLSVDLDYRNNTKHIITVGEVSPGIGGRKVMLKGLGDRLVYSYFKLLFESALLLGAQKEDAIHDITDLLNFQIEIIKLTTPQEETRNLSKFYNKMTVQELQLLAPNTPWLQLFTGVFNQTVFITDEVLVHNPIYVKQIDNLLTITNKRILSNHMIADIVLSSHQYLSSKWRRINDNYVFEISGKRPEPHRWKTCIQSASSLFTAFSALYVRKHFKEESKQKVKEMVAYIHKEFIETLDKIEWFNEMTREKALEKAHSIKTHIGYPEQLLDNSKIAEVYEDLEEYSEDQYFDNALKLSKYTINYSIKDLREPRIRGNWINYAGAAVINAYYSSIENAIIFPAGILQGLFFNNDKPNYINYGSIGTVIGHEISHSMDDIGKQFDKEGNNNNWWDFETDLKFRNRTDCLIHQYNNYVVPENGMRINGINTLGENIADNSGVKEAFKAYKAYIRDHKAEQMLPGLKYRPDQLFWLSYSNTWCSLFRPEIFKLIIAQESHSPARFRVIGTLSNLKEFAESFNCPKGTPMNPIDKCTVW